MAKQPNTGIIYSLSAGQPVSDDESGYDALSYVQAAELTNVPSFGATIAVIESNPLETGIVEKFKGFKNYGSVAFDFDLDDEDAGQQLLISGADGAEDTTVFSHKLEYPNGEVRYFQGQIFSFTETPGGTDSMITANSSVEISTPILRIAAA